MPFQVKYFQENIASTLPEATFDALVFYCKEYATRTTPLQKARCLQEMMIALDQAVDVETRRAIMEACGCKCICGSVLKKARLIQKEAQDIDDLLQRLNQAHIGGGSLYREGSTIHASYARCYCGSVSQTREPISSTYCHCSCGWFRQLFETIFGHQVEVRLLGSIIKGDQQCQFLIDIGEVT